MDKFVKDPNARLDYTWDWSDFLGAGEIIAEAVILLDPGDEVLVAEDPANDDTTVTVWLSGGVQDRRYLVTCRVTTSEDRVEDRSISLTVAQR